MSKNSARYALGYAAVSVPIILSLLWLFVSVRQWSPGIPALAFAPLLALYAASHGVRLLRLKLMVRRIGASWGDVFLAHFGSGIFGLLPFKIGDIARIFFLRLATATTPRAVAMLVLERTLDAFALSLLMAVLTPLLFKNAGLDTSLPLLVAAVAVGGCATALGLYLLVARVSRRAAMQPGRESLSRRLRMVLPIRRGLQFAKSTFQGNVLQIVLCSLSIWALEIAAASFVVRQGQAVFASSAFNGAFESVFSMAEMPDSIYGFLLHCVLAAGAVASLVLVAVMYAKRMRLGTSYTPSISQKVYLVYDAGVRVPDSLIGIAGAYRFSDIRYKGRTVGDVFTDHARSAVPRVPLVTERDPRRLKLKLMELDDDAVFICVSSRVFLRSPDILARLVEIGPAVEGEFSDLSGGVGMLKSRSSVHAFVDGCIANTQRVMPLESVGRDLADRDSLGWLLSFNTDTRHFNTLVPQDELFVKSSVDVAKIKREYTFYGLLPEAMKPWFVEPFSYKEEGGEASYAMRRIMLPNVASHWVQGAFDAEHFAQLLEGLFRFVGQRVRKEGSRDEALRRRRALYVDKVASRFEQLKRWDMYPRLDHAFSGVSGMGGLDELYADYFTLYENVAARTKCLDVAVGHGDLCFSNILYDRDARELHFVDPKGALLPDEMYMDAYYDVCKLSHSVIGGYDFINMFKCEMRIDKGMRAEVVPDASDLSWARPLFEKAVVAGGFDMRFVRLGELSLFLSMVPLHIDYPDKVLAYLLVARNIMEELTENGCPTQTTRIK